MAHAEEKLFKCRRCGKGKKEGEGYLKADGQTFCCKACCDADGNEKKPKRRDGEVCEFC